MDSKELQQKFNSLKEELESLKLKKARAETQLESLEESKETTFNTLKTMTKVDTIEEVKKIHEKLKVKIEELVTEAEGLLEESDE